jgi:alkanesulfonate monooxygenase SsuD/methylene tetrahydromethanopterin reductase-like flavin-dependent oxidoreductase (luciferase family)
MVVSHTSLPAVSVVAVPRKRADIIALAVEAERRGFAGLALPSLGATMGLAVSLAHATGSIPFWTSIQPIYYSHPVESANTAAHIHEVSGGRFRFGIGVSHGPVTSRLGVATGRPLSDIAAYVERMRANERFGGELPPLWLATLRNRMLGLATEIADGAVWANASLRGIVRQLDEVPAARREGFALANMVPVVIDDDVAAARAVNRRTMTGYVILPNYRNYWREAGWSEEMDAIEDALGRNDRDSLPGLMSDAWLDDCTVSGPPSLVRDRLEQGHAAGVAPVAVMSSTSGGQAKAIGELFAAYS